MPNTIKEGQRFPLPCPQYNAMAGLPFIASTTMQGGVIRVGMRCGECSHEWRFDMPVAPEARTARTDDPAKELN